MNLSLLEAAAPDTHTVYRRKSTGQAIALRVTSAFANRFADVPREQLQAAGREVTLLDDADIFEALPVSPN